MNLLKIRCGSEHAINLLEFYGDRIDGSELFSACIEEALASKYTKHTEILQKKLMSGLMPNDFNVTTEITDPHNLKLCAHLIKKDEFRLKLTDMLIATMSTMKNFKLMVMTPTVRECYMRLKMYEHDRIVESLGDFDFSNMEKND